jgi:hypothetical protein
MCESFDRYHYSASQGDFRAVRVVLQPQDFALGADELDPPPSDLIAEAGPAGAVRSQQHAFSKPENLAQRYLQKAAYDRG